MRLFIEPSDVLLFRSSRPFNAGESGYLVSLFPPTPETIQGAIRARIAACWNPVLAEAFKDKTLTDLIGKYEKDRYENVGQFRLRGYTLGRRTATGGVELLFPPPAHLLRGEESGKLYRLVPKEPDTMRTTNMPDGLWLLEPEGGYPQEKLENAQGWLTLEELHYALGSDSDKLKAIKGVPARKLFKFEPRLGIGMNNATKTTREGFLYQVSFVRLKPGVGFLVDVGLQGVEPDQVQKQLKLPDKGWLALGGERRAASYQVLGPAPAEEQRVLERGERMCVYFSTPTYFDAGWRPSDWQAMFSAVPVGAAVGRWQSIGGWQQDPGSALEKAKLLRRCVPAGSVYFFNGPVEVAGPITQYRPEIGYGIAYKGVWSHV
jgi:CRISPR-associated protein Cmr3